MSLEVKITSPSELGTSEIEAWNGFNISTPGLSTAFLSHPYALVAERSFGNVRVCCARRAGRPAMFFPFQFKTWLHRCFGVGERLAGELSDYFGIVAGDDFRIDPKRLLRISKLNALLFTHLDQSQIPFGLRGEAPDIGHMIDFPKGGEIFWEERRTVDKKFVQDTERRERNLTRDIGPTTFEIQNMHAETELAKLIDEKRRQYHRSGVEDVLQEPATKRFLHALSRQSHPLCSGVLSTLYAGDTWVASHFGLRCATTLHYWFPVYNPDLSMYAPGRILIRKILQAGHSHGINRIDRGAGDTVAKRDLSTRKHEFSRGLWSSRNLNATVYHLGLSLGWRLFR